MKRLLPGMLALALTATACDGLTIGDDSIEGSGTIVREVRQVSGFDSVIIEGGGRVTIDVGAASSLAITSDDNLLPLLTSEVVEETLILGVEEGSSIAPSQGVDYVITTPDLTGISVVGGADFEVTGIDTVSFGIDITGAGNIMLGGTAGNLAVDIRGAGDIDAGNFEVATADIDIAGSGDVLVNASDELRITISGSGDVAYIGNPTLEQSISGSGNISQR